jgi:hypothetical protein
MKTTIEMPDALFAQARDYASHHNMTMKALIEQALRTVMKQKPQAEPFKLADASVGGNGLTPEFQNAAWEKIRDTIYERG